MKERLDVLLVHKGLADSREKAKIMIMEGTVYVNDQKSDKPGTCYETDVKIEVKSNKAKYVSRGGFKLEKAINRYGISLEGLTCMDVGASTGGFTDCMLQNGASMVYCIDVGYGQLDWNLRNSPKVVNLERTNVRYIDKSIITHEVNFFSVDVSFISLTIVLPVIREIISPNGRGVCLIKPQFEAGRNKVGKNGVVREKSVHIEVINKICEFCIQNGFSVLNLDYSPIKGPKGNIEYLVYVEKSEHPVMNEDINAKSVVEESHEKL